MAFLWLAVIRMVIWVGGTIFKTAVLVPLWGINSPEPVKTFFSGPAHYVLMGY